MSLSTILDRLAAQRLLPRPMKRLRPARFYVEWLEHRALLSDVPTITVNSTGDANNRDDNITLREAIMLADGTLLYSQLTTQEQSLLNEPPVPGQEEIVFSIPGNGVQTIQPTSPLPAITRSVAIRGTQDPSGLPQIDIDGSLLQASTADGLNFSVGGNVVEGLIVNNWSGAGLYFDGTNDSAHNAGPGPNNVIESCFLGTDAKGVAPAPNFFAGVELHNSAYNLIGGSNNPGALTKGNLISGNEGNGIDLDNQGDTHNWIEGNYIGTDISGTKPIDAPHPLDESKYEDSGVVLGPPIGHAEYGSPADNYIGNYNPYYDSADPDSKQYDSGGGNVIGGNVFDGIYIVGGGDAVNDAHDLITGNFIGVGSDGQTPVPNGKDGVLILASSLNTVGGYDAEARNIISDNKKNGVAIVAGQPTDFAIPVEKQSAEDNKVFGNYIGTTLNGDVAAPNGDPSAPGFGDGVRLENNASDPSVVVQGNQIGDSGLTDGDLFPGRNVISGNLGDGVDFLGSNISGNSVQGNFIGTDAKGTKHLGNQESGVQLEGDSTGAPQANYIGDSTSEPAGDSGRNIISGNGLEGVYLLGGASYNDVWGNYIGTDLTGATTTDADSQSGDELGNHGNGVRIEQSSGNHIGAAEYPNIICGNGTGPNKEFGVAIIGSQSQINEVQANLIGVGAKAANYPPLANIAGGVLIGGLVGQNNEGGPSSNVIGSQIVSGSLASDSGNVISANSGAGIHIQDGAMQNQMAGNLIGTDPNGAAKGNTGTGIEILDSPDNQIGASDVTDAGTTAAYRNIIVNNGLIQTVNGQIEYEAGVVIEGAASKGNKLLGNYIGVGADGTTPEGNPGGYGVLIDGAAGNFVGDGSAGDGNLISDNSQAGVLIESEKDGNVVDGNEIGPGSGDLLAPGNGIGILIFDAASNTIGSATGAGNLIVGNSLDGIKIADDGVGDTRATLNVVEGNDIGIRPDDTPQGNKLDGVRIVNAATNTIGGGAIPNVISANGQVGVEIQGASSTNNNVGGNYLGTNTKANAAALSTNTGLDGVDIDFGAAQNHIGFTDASNNIQRNVISGNDTGIKLTDAGSGNTVQYDYVGANSDGSAALTALDDPTTQHIGIVIDGTPGTIIGGDSFDAGGNVISGNSGDGIYVDGSQSVGNQIKGNNIGASIPKTVAGVPGNVDSIPNGRNGITLDAIALSQTNSGPSTNTIVSGNLVFSNQSSGITLADGTNGNHVVGNSFESNQGYGVNVQDSPKNFIGEANAGNKILDTSESPGADPSTVTGIGIRITGPNSSYNQIQSNTLDGNAGWGIAIDGGAFWNTIGGAGLGNSIVGSGGSQIEITGQGTVENTVVGNLIGIGTDGKPGTMHGAGGLDYLDGIYVGDEADNNVIGGSSAGLGNTIAASEYGILLNEVSDTFVEGNQIGTNASGEYQVDYANQWAGIDVVGGSNNHIGGDASAPGTAPGNKILGDGVGVVLAASTSGAWVQGNEISHSSGYHTAGANTPDGISGANGVGVLVAGDASNNLIGGYDDTETNSIHDNAAEGVDLHDGAGNSILRNKIFGNATLGINVEPAADADTPAPVLSLATLTRLAGWLQAAPNMTYTLEFFAGASSQHADGSEDDDAEKFVLALAPTRTEPGVSVTADGVQVTTNGSGVAVFDLILDAGSPPVGNFIRATATDSSGNTSQFSNAVAVGDDNNGDGVPDNEQNGNSETASDISFPDALNDNAYITLQAPQGTAFQDVWSVPDPAPADPAGPPADTLFGLGFVSFILTGVPTGVPFVVTMTLPDTGITPTSYWRYGPTTPDSDTPQWYKWDYDPITDTGAQIEGNTVLLHFVDGVRGDDDLTENGVIVDAGGPGFPGPFTVANTNDSGPGSLRQAILNSNANPGADTITFDIPGPGPYSIQPLSPLPTITDDATIDGTTQSGYAGTPLIELDGTQAGAGADGLTVNAAGVLDANGQPVTKVSATIEGLAINRFSGDGIHVFDTGSATIERNYIGTDLTGAVAEGNGGFGIEIQNETPLDPQTFATLGGPSTLSGNVISGNLAGGVTMHGVSANGNTLLQNLIGVAADGSHSLGNQGPGVFIAGGSSGNNVGDGTPDDANTIAYNRGEGVDALSGELDIEGTQILLGTQNAVEANSIFANGGLGIDLGGDGVTPNDDGDGDIGANDLQNFPNLVSAASYGGRTFISGTLDSTPDSGFVIDFYASPAADASGDGQGQTYLGAINVTTDDSGRGSFDANLSATAPQGWFVTATTSPGGSDTSEFSAALQLATTAPVVYLVNTVDDVNDATPDPTHFSLREAIEAANSHPGQDTIDFDLPNLDRVLTPLSALPPTTDPVVIDGTSQPGFHGLPLVELDGSQTPASDGLVISGGGSIVRGLVVHGFAHGITIQGVGGNTIEGNFLGTDVTGTHAVPNSSADVYIDRSPDNTIGGTSADTRNVIDSIHISGYNANTSSPDPNSGGNRIEGNYIGTDLTGAARLSGGLDGPALGAGGIIIDTSSANTIGGVAPGAGNVIVNGVLIGDGGDNVVQGNLIGTDITGTIFLASGGSSSSSGPGPGGVEITGNSSFPANGNLIGGAAPAARNILATGLYIGGYANENSVEGNYIGTDISGEAAIDNAALYGVVIDGSYNTLGGNQPGAGNLISGFGAGLGEGWGVQINADSHGDAIEGNLIGTDATGAKPLPNFVGVRVDGENNVFRGNVISGNQDNGMVLQGTGFNFVQGNLIGTDRTGTVALGNGIFTGTDDDGIYISEPNDIIGGIDPGDGNVISANGGDGIYIDRFEGDARNIAIQGNVVGTDVSGKKPLGNRLNGIHVVNSPDLIVGGAQPAAGNLIAANGGDGILIDDDSETIGGGIPQSDPISGYPATTDTGLATARAVIQGNRIGTDATGTLNLGNAVDGISIFTSYALLTAEQVGGTTLGEGNIVAYNGGRGINVPFGNGNKIEANEIFANGGLGLVTDINSTLASYAETRGLALPGTAPLLTSAVFDPNGTVVSGSLTGAPFTSYDIDFFANNAISPSGFANAQTYHQSLTLFLDASGTASFQVPLNAAVPVGEWITATATPDSAATIPSPSGGPALTVDPNTSQTSPPVQVVAAVDASDIQFSSPTYLATENGGDAVITVTRTGSTAGTATVDYATSDGTALAGTNYTTTSGTLTFNDGDASETVTVPIQDDGAADGDKTFHVALSDATGATLGSVQGAAVAIADSDRAGQIQFASSASTVDQALSGDVLEVTRTGDSQGTVTVDYRVTGGTAIGSIRLPALSEGLDADYLDDYGTLTFDDGQTTAEIDVTSIVDFLNGNRLLWPISKGPRTIELTLGNPTGGATLGMVVSSTLTITDDEDQNGAFQVSAMSSTASVSDGYATFEIDREGSRANEAQIDYTTVDGTAKAGTNYVATSGTLTFPADDGSIDDKVQYVKVPLLDGQSTGDVGDFQLLVSKPTGGTFVYPDLASADVTIVNNPPQQVFQVVSQELPDDATQALITVQRVGDSAGEATVGYTTSDSTARAGVDYQSTSGTLTFDDGETSKTFAVPIVPGAVTSGFKSFFVLLGNPTGGATVGSQTNPGGVDLYATPQGHVQFASSAYRVAENDSSLIVTVDLDRGDLDQFDPADSGNITVDYATHDGTATGGLDYTPVSGTLTFTSNNTATISIPIASDLLVEGDETFDVTLSNPGAKLSLPDLIQIGDLGTTTVTIVDDDAPSNLPTTTILTSDRSAGATYGETITLTAQVSAAGGTPTGSVDFVDQTTGRDLGSATLTVVSGVDEAAVTATGLTAGAHTIVATYMSDSSDFENSPATLAQSVSPATLTVTADDKTKLYGVTVPALTDTISGFVNGDTSSVVNGAAELSTTATSASSVGNYPIDVSLGTFSAANYTFAFVDGNLTVTPAPLTITAKNQTMAYGGALPTLVASYRGFVNGDTPASLTTAPIVSTTAKASSPVGGYTIAVSGADDSNYTISYVPGTLAVTPAMLIVAADNKSMVAGSTLPVLTGTITGFVNGDTLSTVFGAAALNTTASSMSAAGSYPIAVVQGTLSAANYTFAFVDGTLTVTPAGGGSGQTAISAMGVSVVGYEFSPPTTVTVATFTDGNNSLAASDFSAAIDWGDGTSSAGSVTLASGSYTVTGSHEYRDEGHYDLTVSIDQTAGPLTGGTSASVTATATIHEQLLANGTVGTPDENWVQEVYRDLFNRQAELQGLDYWVGLLNQGETRQQVAYQMVQIASFEEFQHDTVAALYEQYLGRAPDIGGLATWSAYLYNGGTIEGMSRALVSSPEYWQARAGGTAEGFVSALFHDALSRAVEPAAVAYFTGLMAQGATSADVAAAVFSSDEYHRLRVGSLFEQFMDRPADQDASAYFAGELDAGSTDEMVISQLLASDEYFALPQV